MGSAGGHAQVCRATTAPSPGAAGKRDLPAPLRNRFTEIWVGEPPQVLLRRRMLQRHQLAGRTPTDTAGLPWLQREDLAAIVAGYLCSVVAGAPVQAIVDFYLGAKAEAVSLHGSLPAACRPAGLVGHATLRCGLACATCAGSVAPGRRRPQAGLQPAHSVPGARVRGPCHAHLWLAGEPGVGGGLASCQRVFDLRCVNSIWFLCRSALSGMASPCPSSPSSTPPAVLGWRS